MKTYKEKFIELYNDVLVALEELCRDLPDSIYRMQDSDTRLEINVDENIFNYCVIAFAWRHGKVVAIDYMKQECDVSLIDLQSLCEFIDKKRI